MNDFSWFICFFKRNNILKKVVSVIFGIVMIFIIVVFINIVFFFVFVINRYILRKYE